MKTLLALALIFSANVSALADSTQFLPRPAIVPVVQAAGSANRPSHFQPYARAYPRVQGTKAALPSEASGKMPSRFRRYSRDYRS